MLSAQWRPGYVPMVFGRNANNVLQYALARSLLAAGLCDSDPRTWSKLSLPSPEHGPGVIDWLVEQVPWVAREFAAGNLPLSAEQGVTYEEVSQTGTALMRHFQDPFALLHVGQYYFDMGQGGMAARVLEVWTRAAGTTRFLEQMLSVSHQFNNLMRAFSDPAQTEPQQAIVRSPYLIPPRLFDCDVTTGVYQSVPSIGRRSSHVAVRETHCGCDPIQILNDCAAMFGSPTTVRREGSRIYADAQLVGTYIRLLSPPRLLPFSRSLLGPELEEHLHPIEGTDYQVLAEAPDFDMVTGAHEMSFSYPRDPNVAFLATRDVEVLGRTVIRRGRIYAHQMACWVTQDNRPRGHSLMPEVLGWMPTCVHYSVWEHPGMLEAILRRLRSPLGTGQRLRELEASLARSRALNARLVESEARLREAIQENRRYANAFLRQFPRGAARMLVDGNLRSVTIPATVMFTDMAGFTAWSRAMYDEHGDEASAKISDAIMAMHTPFVGILMSNRCFVDKFEGDALMAVAGLPLGQEFDADHATFAHVEEMCLSAWLIRRTMYRGDIARKNRVTPLGLRMGIATGMVNAGPTGSPQKPTFTVMGNAVNTAKRMESVVAREEGEIVLDEKAAEIARYTFELAELPPTPVKGLGQDLRTWMLVDLLPPLENPYRIAPGSRAATDPRGPIFEREVRVWWDEEAQPRLFRRETPLFLDDADYREAAQRPRASGEIWGPLEDLVQPSIAGLNITRFDAVTGHIYGSLLRALVASLLAAHLSPGAVVTIQRCAFLYDCEKNRVDAAVFGASDPPGHAAVAELNRLRDLSLAKVAEQWPGTDWHTVLADAYQPAPTTSPGAIVAYAAVYADLVSPVAYQRRLAWSPELAATAATAARGGDAYAAAAQSAAAWLVPGAAGRRG